MDGFDRLGEVGVSGAFVHVGERIPVCTCCWLFRALTISGTVGTQSSQNEPVVILSLSLCLSVSLSLSLSAVMSSPRVSASG